MTILNLNNDNIIIDLVFLDITVDQVSKTTASLMSACVKIQLNRDLDTSVVIVKSKSTSSYVHLQKLDMKAKILLMLENTHEGKKLRIGIFGRIKWEAIF